MHSIILTIHNGARKISTGEILLEKVLEGIINNTVGDYEILCMLDGCTDESETIVNRYKKRANIKKHILPDIYEVKTNNVGFRHAKGEYVIIVQDDQVITEHGWNARMQKPFDNFNDVFAVTARCAHNWIFNPNSFYLNNPDAAQNTWSDIIEHVDHSSIDHGQLKDIFAVRASANRGPLMICLDDLKKINYLDEKFAPCDMDDHDLMFRAYSQLGKVCGSYVIGVDSKPEWSGSCKGGPPPSWHLKSHHKNVRIFYERHKDLINTRRIIEDRKL